MWGWKGEEEGGKEEEGRREGGEEEEGRREGGKKGKGGGMHGFCAIAATCTCSKQRRSSFVRAHGQLSYVYLASTPDVTYVIEMYQAVPILSGESLGMRLRECVQSGTSVKLKCSLFDHLWQ